MTNAGAFIAAKQREIDAMYAEFHRRMVERQEWELELMAEFRFAREVRPWYRKVLQEPARWYRMLAWRYRAWKENRE